MIQVIRQDSKLIVRLDHGLLGNDGYLLLEWNATTELLAAALVKQVQQLLQNTVREVREEEYLKGYKDGRAKRGKKTWFWAVLKKEGR